MPPLPRPARKWLSLLAFSLPLSAFCLPLDNSDVRETAASGFVPLLTKDCRPEILIDAQDARLIGIAAKLLAADIEKATGTSVPVLTIGDEAKGPLILIGTLGHSALIDRLVAEGKLEVGTLRGAWESHTIVTVKNPFPKVESALVIVGSDRRGTAYGVFTLSESLGVSPWNWWADVPVAKKSALYVREGDHSCASPEVRYRGIFINDEDWGLHPWAAKTFDPATKDIGPRTYERVFELLLRLKANLLWPAMHKCSAAFNSFPENARLADDYGIVMGASHCEPLLRNNVREWDYKANGEWNYVTNAEGVRKYWDERLRTNGGFDNLYTVGMRGIHDSGMPGGGTLAEQRYRLQKIITDQRELLTARTGKAATELPQVFCPYKEVMDIYREGLQLPDDITLLWADDNYGYIRQLSNPAERARRGGSGVYYHLSYLGYPMSYVWLNSTPPALIHAEMGKAFELGARQVWIANVGDIKSCELSTEFFLRFAWAPSAMKDFDQASWLNAWAQDNFTRKHGPAVAKILQGYLRQNFPQKPEFAHINRGSLVFNFDKESGPAFDRVAGMADLVKRAEDLAAELPEEYQDSYYQLVLYPVRCAHAVNLAALENELARRLALAGETAKAELHKELALKAWNIVTVNTRDYNGRIAKGKWRYMMEPTAYSKQRLFETLELPQADVRELRLLPSTKPVLTLQAEHFDSRTKGASGVSIAVLRDLGADSDVIASDSVSEPVVPKFPRVVPVMKAGTENQPKVDLSLAPSTTYGFELAAETHFAILTCFALPTQPSEADGMLRCAVSVDGGQPNYLHFNTKSDEKNPAWRNNILQGFSRADTTFTSLKAGKHTLKVWILDPGLLMDRFEISSQ